LFSKDFNIKGENAIMFGKGKVLENRYIIAVKNYSETVEKLKAGTISLPYDSSIYMKLISSQSSKVDSLKDIKKFAKENGKKMTDVKHYWEGLIADGFTLLNVEYSEKIPAIDHVCNNDFFKFVCMV